MASPLQPTAHFGPGSPKEARELGPPEVLIPFLGGLKHVRFWAEDLSLRERSETCPFPGGPKHVRFWAEARRLSTMGGVWWRPGFLRSSVERSGASKPVGTSAFVKSSRAEKAGPEVAATLLKAYMHERATGDHWSGWATGDHFSRCA